FVQYSCTNTPSPNSGVELLAASSVGNVFVKDLSVTGTPSVGNANSVGNGAAADADDAVARAATNIANAAKEKNLSPRIIITPLIVY
ncbi:MAG: hypothetical protein ABSB69_04240, partial [Solirubrobacteraceae bacterium]